MCHKDIKQANVVGKMAPVDLLSAATTNFQFVKKKQNTIKQRAIYWYTPEPKWMSVAMLQ